MVQIPVKKFNDSIFDWQLDVLSTFDQWRKGLRPERFYLVKCHRRARKTTLLLNLLIRECLRYPNSVCPYVGPTYTEAKAVVWRDPNMLFSYLPPKDKVRWVSNESELFVKFPNGSILPILGSDKPDSLRGIDARGVGFDEWALQKKEVWYEIFRPIISQSKDRWAMFTYTPKGVTHATDMEQQSEEWEDWHKIVLRASVSGIIPEDELKKARREMPPWLYDQEYECADITDEELTLITSALMESLKGAIYVHRDLRRIVSCDPDCSISGDEAVIYAMENGSVIDEDIFHERDPDKIAFRVDLMCQKHEIWNTIVDNIGIGEGIYSRLAKKRNLNVQKFDAREKAGNSERFYNKKAEAWWYVMEQMMAKKVIYPGSLMLRQDLSSVRVRPNSLRIQLEPKVETKKRLGRSPDRGDTYIMGVYGLQFVMPDEVYERQGYFDDRCRRETIHANSYSFESSL